MKPAHIGAFSLIFDSICFKINWSTTNKVCYSALDAIWYHSALAILGAVESGVGCVYLYLWSINGNAKTAQTAKDLFLFGCPASEILLFYFWALLTNPRVTFWTSLPTRNSERPLPQSALGLSWLSRSPVPSPMDQLLIRVQRSSPVPSPMIYRSPRLSQTPSLMLLYLLPRLHSSKRQRKLQIGFLKVVQ